jgi:hypothetical protein
MTSAARHSTTSATGVPDPQDIHAGVWHAHTLASPVQSVQATGDALLDAHLPGGVGRWVPWWSCCNLPARTANGVCCFLRWRRAGAARW